MEDMNPALKTILTFIANNETNIEAIQKLKTTDATSKVLIDLWTLKEKVRKSPTVTLPEKETAEFMEHCITHECNQNTHYLIIGIWFYIAFNHPHFYSEINRLNNHLLNIKTNGLNTIIVGFNTGNLFYYFMARERDIVLSKKYLHLHLKAIKTYSPNYYTVLKRILILGLPFELHPNEKDLQLLFEGASKEDLKAIPVIMFFNTSDRLNIRQAMYYLDLIPKDFSYEPVLNRIKNKINTLYKHVFVLNISDLNSKEKNTASKSLKKHQEVFNSLSTQISTFDEELLDISNCLHSRNLNQATIIAKNIYKNYNQFNIKTYKTTQVYKSILNIELCNRNLKESEMLYSKYSKCYHFHQTDLRNFYQARIFLLKGNIDKAKEYFFLAKEYFYKQDAKILFRYHIDCALDMTPELLIELFSHRPNKIEEPTVKAKGLNEKKDIIKGISRQTEELIVEINKVAKTEIPILILGETGTGKEVAAQAIHKNSSRKNKPFIAVNCSSISDTLIESELFGHVKGAFTGANNNREGLFETAKDGTIFLDEIGDTSPRLQASLLRVLEANEIKPAGSSKTKKINCRIIAATNAHLEDRVQEGKFRQDLLYRLNRYIINIKPLRKRQKDILYLAKYFLESDFNKKNISFTLEAEKALTQYFWPGNIRELRNVIERMYLFNNKDLYHINDLDDKLVSFYKESNPSYQENFTENKLKENKTSIQIKNTGARKSKEELIKSLFIEYKKLTRKELVKLIDISEPTATTYLKKLVMSNFIKKIMPNSSPRSHYFILN